jgi:hypothetical protein
LLPREIHCQPRVVEQIVTSRNSFEMYNTVMSDGERMHHMVMSVMKRMYHMVMSVMKIMYMVMS